MGVEREIGKKIKNDFKVLGLSNGKVRFAISRFWGKNIFYYMHTLSNDILVDWLNNKELALERKENSYVLLQVLNYFNIPFLFHLRRLSIENSQGTCTKDKRRGTVLAPCL